MTRTRIVLVVTLMAMGAAIGYGSTRFSPALYASDSVLAFIAPRVPEEFVRGGNPQSDSDLPVLAGSVLTRTRVERLIENFGLYTEDRGNVPMNDLVRRVRDHVRIAPIGGDQFRVSFSYPDPRIAMRVTETITAALVEENMRSREMSAENTNQFLSSQLYATAKRLDAKQAEFEAIRKQGRQPALSEQLQFEALQESYRSLLRTSEEANMASNLERRQIGASVSIVDAARLPVEPIDRGAAKLSLISGGIGLLAGLGIAFRRPRS
jgi:hypothetical protein